MKTPGDLCRVGTVDVARLFDGGEEEIEAIVFEISSPDSEETGLYWMYDSEAYEFIRRLTAVLFAADPPRSGVGSPGALHGP